MPGLDRRGPIGNGPMTGGGRGLCNAGRASIGADRSEIYGGGAWRRRGQWANDASFMGMGRRGFGRRLGFNSFYPYEGNTEGAEIEMLKIQAKAAKETLDQINKRIAEIEKM